MLRSAIEIARRAPMRCIADSARERLDMPGDQLVPGTAISPTPAGEGQTTRQVGLGGALNHIGNKAMQCVMASGEQGQIAGLS